MGMNYENFISKVRAEDQQNLEKLKDPRNGYHLHWFKCDKKINGEDFHRGSILSGFQRQVEARFFNLRDTKIGDEKSLLRTCEISRFVTFPNVIKSKGFAVANDTIFIAYEAFEDTYSSWAKTHSTMMSQGWWIEQARKISESMYHMANQGIYHEGLDKLETYVSFRDDLHLLHVATMISPKEKAQQSEMGKKCLQCLKTFMLSQANEKFQNNLDWLRFLEAFDHSTIDQLRQHPFLLTGIERYKHYRKTTNLIRNYMGETEKNKLKEMLNSHTSYYNWAHGWDWTNVFKYVLEPESGTASIRETPYQLLQFIEKVLDHYDEQAEKRKMTSQIADHVELELKISNIKPGFFSLVHNCILQIYPDATHFPHVLRVTSYHSDVTSSFLR